jgi:hypothetical protein
MGKGYAVMGGRTDKSRELESEETTTHGGRVVDGTNERTQRHTRRRIDDDEIHHTSKADSSS